jgi:murein DD-endopeptidase MepM/ murein hydrolase activator NlpD
MRRLLCCAVVAFGAAGVSAPANEAGDVPRLRARGILIPVASVRAEQLADTFLQGRAGGARSHEALDIAAAHGTPVVAADDGKIVKLFKSRPGGITIYQFDPGSEYAYYYAHLAGYADGIQEGAAVRKGQVIGYVGSTGNASPEAPHLHFAVFLLGPLRQWWRGTPINPFAIWRDVRP